MELFNVEKNRKRIKMEKITIIGVKFSGNVEILGYDIIEEWETEFDIEESINRLWNEGGGWFENRSDLYDYSWRYGRWTEDELAEEVKNNADNIDENNKEVKFVPLKIIDPDTGEVIVEEVE